MSDTVITVEEKHKKIILKSRRWLSDFISEVAEDCNTSKESRMMLSKVIGTEFRNLMENDEDFYNNVEAFCTGAPRRTRTEKQLFCNYIMTQMTADGNIHRKLAEKYPDKYTLPKRYRS